MIKKILSRPLTILVIFLLLSLIGVFMVSDLPIDLLPDMNPPYIYVSTRYPAAGSEEVEGEVTDILEEQLYTLEGLKSMTSTSSEGSSGILLEFTWGDDPAKIKQDIRDKLDTVTGRLPDDAADPVIYEYDPNSQPIMTLSLRGGHDVQSLYTFAEDELKDEIEQVKDISKVEITGGRDKIVRVAVDANRLDAYGLSVTRLARALSTQNLSLGAGSIDYKGNEFLVRTSGEYSSIDHIANTIVTTISADGERHKILVRDVADVSFDYEKETSRVLVNGEPSVTIKAFKKTGANTVEVAEGIRELIISIAQELPEAITLDVLSDSSTIIKQSLSSVLQAAYTGIICSIFVLLFFLRQIRTTVIVAISIPVSILITIIGMSLGGKTFNVVALTGLTLGVGMIVDNSIVILENIFSHREQKVRLLSASRFGTEEMITPIFASTLTTISVFLPILLFGDRLGSIGAIMNDLAFTVIVALAASFLVALFLVPVLSAHYLKIHTREEKPIKNPLLRMIDKGIGAFINGLTWIYRTILQAVLQVRIAVIVGALALLAVSLLQFPKLGLNFMPPVPSDSLSLSVELPEGSSLHATKQVMNQLEAIAMDNLTGYEQISQTAGASNSYTGSLTITLPDLADRSMSEAEMKKTLREYFYLFPDITFVFGNRGTGPMSGAEFSLGIQGSSLQQVTDYGLKVMDHIRGEIDELAEVTLDAGTGRPQWDIEINRTKAYDLGIDMQSAASEIRNQLAGTTATTLNDESGETYDVLVQLRKQDRKKISELERLFVLNAAGQKIPVSSFATIVTNTSPETINHTDQQRTVTITGDLAAGASVNFVEQKVQQLIQDKLPPDPELTLSYGGEMEDIRESGTGLLLVLAFAVVLVFGVMASQFESLKAPFIIILALPMVAVGVIGIYMIMGLTFSMISLIGVVMLSGIVVNNGIVLVDYINLLRARGHSLSEACINGGASRLRPILMTTLTTIFSMVPLAFFSDEGAELMQPLAVTVVGGLSVNMVISLLLVPVLYSIVYRKQNKEVQA